MCLSLVDARQGLLNHFAVGLHHLFEQQQILFYLNCVANLDEEKEITQKAHHLNDLIRSYRDGLVKDSEKLEELDQAINKERSELDRRLRPRNLRKRLKDDLEIRVKGFRSWQPLEELRLIANAVKHGLGSSTAELFHRKPELFKSPFTKDSEWMEFFPDYISFRPVAGRGLYVDETDLRFYGRMVKKFWDELLGATGPQTDMEKESPF